MAPNKWISALFRRATLELTYTTDSPKAHYQCGTADRVRVSAGVRGAEGVRRVIIRDRRMCAAVRAVRRYLNGLNAVSSSLRITRPEATAAAST